MTAEGIHRLGKHHHDEFTCNRADRIHQMLMEDFDFLDAARWKTGNFEPPTFNYKDVVGDKAFRKAALAHPNGLIDFDHFTYRTPSRIFEDPKIDPDIRSLRFEARTTSWPPVPVWAHWLLHTKFFSWLMVLVIVANSVVICVDQELQNKGDQEEENLKWKMFLEALDFFFLCLFITEIILKWLDDFNRFWRDRWHIFDFIVTSVSIIPVALDLYSQASGDEFDEDDNEFLILGIKYVRISRIFRALNVVTKFENVQKIWEAVVKTFTALIYIVILMLIFFYIFAIIGLQLFEKHKLSHNPDLRFRTAFSSLSMAFVTLFQLFTLDLYNDVIEELGQEVGYYFSVPYVLIWILLGSFIFRNIFVGVMVNSFQTIREMAQKETEHALKKRAEDIDIFVLDQLENEGLLSDDALVDWESEIFHSLEILGSLRQKVSPVFWPRDTMFLYYMLLEAYASNVEERERIMELLDKALLSYMDA